MIKTLSNGIRLHLGENEIPIDVAQIEQLKNATFIGEFCLGDKHGGWVNAPAQLYWQENPPEGYSNYFALYLQRGAVMITSGASIVNNPIAAVISNGDAVYSKYRWHMNRTPDGLAVIDGGRDHTKVSGNSKVIYLGFDGPNIIILP
jgi:hypothetical protein